MANNELDFATLAALARALGGSADPAVIEAAVSDWLDQHPEATTTVQDGSITNAKLDASLRETVAEVGDLKTAITGNPATASNTGSGAKYISYPITDGETYVISNTGAGIIGTIITQASGSNVENVVSNLAANATIEWTAGDDADRFYVYFNAASSVVIYTKSTIYGEIKDIQKSTSEMDSAIDDIEDDIVGIKVDAGNYAENEKSSAGWVVFDYNIVSGTTYRIRTGAGIFGWIKTMDNGNHDVETIYQNCPANSDFTWTASDNAVKIYLYYNAASTFSIVENNSIRDTIIQNDILVNAKFENQSSFSKNSGGNSYNVFPITKGHSYAICNNGSGILGSMSTLTASNTSVQSIISGVSTPPGGMVVFTAIDDAAKVYVYYNSASAIAIFDLGAAKSNAELVSLSIAKGYSDIATYKVGEYCIYNLRLYKCKTEIGAAETWTEAHWELADAVTVAGNLALAEARAEVITTPNYSTDTIATGAYISEDMSIVGNELWLFTQATAIGGTADGYISRLSLSDYSVMEGQMTHNLGHCGTTDYDADNDRMVICGADNGTADTPYLYIYSDVSDWAELQSVLYANVTVDRIDLSALASAYSPVTYMAACWGPKILDGNKLLYVYGGGNWYLLLMGTGTTQLNMGSYTEASAGRYNGTYKVLNYWKYETHVPWDAYDDVMQGAVMHDGIVYTSNGHRAITLRKWQFRDNHVATCEQIRTPWINADGTESTAQGQGVDFKDGKPIVAVSTGYIATVD